MHEELDSPHGQEWKDNAGYEHAENVAKIRAEGEIGAVIGDNAHVGLAQGVGVVGPSRKPTQWPSARSARTMRAFCRGEWRAKKGSLSCCETKGFVVHGGDLFAGEDAPGFQAAFLAASSADSG